MLVDPWSDAPPVVTSGACEGTIGRSASGSGGFGYDPIFEVAGLGRTMAELEDDEKNRVSHRSRMSSIIPIASITSEFLSDVDA